MALRSQRAKLVLKDLGNPDIIKTQPETVKRYVHGTLVVMADGFLERTDPKSGQVYEGLTGMFRSIPADEKEEELESGVLFIPDAFHNLIAGTLREQQKIDPNAKVNTVFEIASVRASNPQGRSWDFKPLIENQAANPVDNLLAQVGMQQKLIDGKRTLALPAPAAAATDKVAAKK